MSHEKLDINEYGLQNLEVLSSGRSKVAFTGYLRGRRVILTAEYETIENASIVNAMQDKYANLYLAPKVIHNLIIPINRLPEDIINLIPTDEDSDESELFVIVNIYEANTQPATDIIWDSRLTLFEKYDYLDAIRKLLSVYCNLQGGKNDLLVTHLDIKTLNIVFQIFEDNIVAAKLIDFEVNYKNPEESTRFGTLLYIAIEAFQESRNSPTALKYIFMIIFIEAIIGDYIGQFIKGHSIPSNKMNLLATKLGADPKILRKAFSAYADDSIKLSEFANKLLAFIRRPARYES